ncbi:PREDICTED: nose resistant to fluoxetine protein 6-like [Priapulus caudatus]|uniref:Nose resistant to fluoxetine protein 6-like n=1 Tax=Priapulus caudatus TaxID=37621 RepID=A0ABM1EB17_PRICU|nr:PREDICTED: nose resistant to fluoxetine protein 6-like [Priapulus caudatus]
MVVTAILLCVVLLGFALDTINKRHMRLAQKTDGSDSSNNNKDSEKPIEMIESPKAESQAEGRHLSERLFDQIWKAKLWLTASKPGNIIEKILLCFSWKTNASKISNTKQSSNSIKCVHGLRTLSMTWVIMGHSLTSAVYKLDNMSVFLRLTKQWTFYPMLRAIYSVDTFFCISGILVVYGALAKLESTRNTNKPAAKSPKFWLYYYYHRFSRKHTLDSCRKYWWTNILYINTIYPKSIGDTCMGWTWYLSDDTIFHWISPLIILPLYWKPIVGLVWTGILTAGGLAIRFGIAYTKDIAYSDHMTVPAPGSEILYFHPAGRITPYLAGMATGYLLYKCKGKTVKLHWALVISGWLTCFITLGSLIWGLYGNAINEKATTPTGDIVLQTFSNLLWAIAICWIVFAGQHGYGGVVNSFLSWKGWVLPSRLSFGAYLLHPIIFLWVEAATSETGTTTHLSDHEIRWQYLLHILYGLHYNNVRGNTIHEIGNCVYKALSKLNHTLWYLYSSACKLRGYLGVICGTCNCL